MGKALYRKYRSKTLSDVIGQEHVTTTLQNTLDSGNISHAYLFTGPRGVGKTSVARILAHAVNDLPYDEQATNLDIIEIDAASNRRIDEIRELRERVHNAPSSLKYKVYIIDEVHMLTREAFNALLKTLEEPPEHAIFILATTEAHKLPETIISRTQRFSFRPIAKLDAVEHLRSIAKDEKVEIDDAALERIAEHGEGSFRDSISLLDQATGLNKAITLKDVEQLLGRAPAAAIGEVLEAVKSSSRAQLLTTLSSIHDEGYLPNQLSKQLASVLRAELIDPSHGLPTETLLNLLNKLIEIPASHDPQTLLEITLLGAIVESPQPEAGINTKPTIENTKPKKAVQQAPTEPDVTVTSLEEPQVKDQSLNDETWAEVLVTVKARHNTLYSVLRMAEPHFSEDSLLLVFGFPFHYKQLSDEKKRQKVVDIIQEITGRRIQVSCELKPKPGNPAKSIFTEATTPKRNPLATINDVFGSAEVID